MLKNNALFLIIMNQNAHYWLLATLLLCFSLISFASVKPHVRFSQLTNTHGLSQLNVNAITQDHNGFMWIATSDGLNRFDGYEVKVYRPSKQHSGWINDNLIIDLLVDNDNALWVATSKGLDKYDSKTDTFTHYPLIKADGSQAKAPRILKLLDDANGSLWIGTDGQGLKKLNKKTKQYSDFPPINRGAIIRAQDTISGIAKAADGTIWVAAHDGLYYLTEGDTRLSRYQFAQGHQLSTPHIMSLSLEGDTLWLGTSLGLNRLNLVDGTVKTYGKDKIPYLYIDRQHTLWLATYKGIARYNRQSDDFTYYVSDANNPASIAGQVFSTIFQDSSDILWFGSAGAGVSLLDLSSSQFGHYNTANLSKDCLSGNNIYAVTMDKQHNLWIGAWGGGLHKIHWPTFECTRFTHDKNKPTSLANHSISALYVDSVNDLWIGMTDNGISRLKSGATEFEHFRNDSNNPNSLLHGSVFAITEDHNRNLWVGTAAGLTQLSLTDGQYTRYRHHGQNSNSLAGNYINVLMTDKDGMIWIGTEQSGLDKFNPYSGQFSHYLDASEGPDGQINKILALKQDSNGNIWIGSSGHGLIKYQPSKDNFEHFSTLQGLPGKSIYAIAEDSDKQLWLASNNGLSQFSIEGGQVVNFKVSDGLQDLEFNQQSLFDSHHELMVFTGSNGFNAFDPKHISTNRIKPKIAITNFRLFNKSIKPTAGHTPSGQIANISEVKNLLLSHQDSMFTFEFAGLHFADPSRNQYAYRLEPFDINWNYTDARYRQATYTNIAPGHYQFRVIASNKNGLWDQQGLTINIEIEPPLWLTWWAKTLYLILFIATPVMIYRIRTQALVERTAELSHQVEQRTQELSDEKIVVERLLQQKNNEFANMSHEFRTPLSLILSAAKSLTHSQTQQDRDKKAQIVQNNSLRLLRMVEQLLQMEKFQVNRLAKPKPHALKTIVEMLVQSFAGQAKDKNIALSIEQLDDVWLLVPLDMIETIIANLLSNALKYTPPDGFVTISVVELYHSQCSIEVKDSGIGISEQQQKVIFERFERVLDAHTEVITGAGIGLALVKELVQAQGGEINLISELGKGSRFKVILPGIIEPSTEATPLPSSLIDLEREHLALQLSEDESNALQVKQITPTETSNPLLLVVEDNPGMRALILEIIAPHYSYLSAANGEQGQILAKSELPDLIISDITMPKKDGYQLSQEIRADITTCHIPIILLTAKGDAQSRIKGWQEHIDDYITKPFDADELLLRIRSLLAVRDILKQRFSEQIQVKPVVQNIKPPEKKTTDELNEKNQAFIAKMMKIIEQHYADPNFNVASLSEKMALSDRQLRRKLVALTDKTPSDYIRQVRLNAAKQLLQTGERVNIVADSTGFSSATYFGNCFRAQFGVSPSQFQKQNNELSNQ